MLIINMVRDVQPVRMGVWTAATNTASVLHSKYKVDSEIWYPGESYGCEFDACQSVSLGDRSINCLKKLLSTRKLDPLQTVIVAHSPWGYQTHWMKYLSKLGFRTMFVPHGTLEPWSLGQKALKKKVYFRLFENHNVGYADVIRALSVPEYENLGKLFPKGDVELIPNGVSAASKHEVETDVLQFLFIGRLHHKKGVEELARGWRDSKLANDPDYRLVIAGPNEGELDKIQESVNAVSNMEYVGAVYDEAKEELLSRSQYFVLPSASEGFPVAVLEAAEYGLCPIISEGCNFPELFDKDMAIKVRKTSQSVKETLERASDMRQDVRLSMVAKLQDLIRREYSIEAIADKQYAMFSKMLKY